MIDRASLMSQLLLSVQSLGFHTVNPQVLSDGGNLIVHLAPHPVVARLAVAMSAADPELAYRILQRELQVARHLQTEGVLVLPPAELADAGPHPIGGAWMTLWSYRPPLQLPPPSPAEAAALVNKLSAAMRTFPDRLPVLGVWERACRSAARLGGRPDIDERLCVLLRMFKAADERMRLEPEMLVPSHGDAHARNLVSVPDGWAWTDFEDASLMPAYWDMASYVGNLALFGGLQEPTFQYMLSDAGMAADAEAFAFAITARTLMSVLGNLDLALEGHGDMSFAARQLELAEPFIQQVNSLIGQRYL